MSEQTEKSLFLILDENEDWVWLFEGTEREAKDLCEELTLQARLNEPDDLGDLLDEDYLLSYRCQRIDPRSREWFLQEVAGRDY